ncbi:tetratricopeptide repeat protein [candidate division WOR-3 bacterium]|nr:tetratricopeptide repeat protein [candidate division WOR-3 bacterium]
MKEENDLSRESRERNSGLVEKEISASKDSKKTFSLLIELSVLHEKEGKYHLSLQAIEKATIIAAEVRSDDSLATAYHIAGRLYYKIKNYEKSIENYLNALTLRESLNDPDKISATLNNLSIVYIEILKYDNALECLLKALNCSEYTGDHNSVSGICNNIGILYLRTGEVEKANSYFEKSLKIIEKTGDDKILSDLYMNIGISLCETEDYEDSLEYFKKSADIKRKIKDRKGISSVFLNLGKAYKFLGNYSEALKLLNESLNERMSSGDKKDLATVNHTIGSVYMETGDMKKALSFLEKAYEYSSDIDMLYHKIEIVKDLSEVSKNLGEYDRAYELLIEYYRIKEAINDNEKKTKMMELELSHEIDKIERENRILTDKNIELEQAKKKIDLQKIELQKVNDELAGVLQLKENLLDVISKDIKENIGSIKSVAELIAMMKRDNKDDYGRYLKSIGEAVRTSLDLIEKITVLSRLEDPNFILKLEKKNIASLLERDLQALEKSAQKKNVELKTVVNEKNLNVMLDETSFYEILENLIENAVQHSEQGQKIQIELTRKSGNAVLTFRDKGISIMADKANSVFDKFGSSLRNGIHGERNSGLGFAIVKRLVECHKGTINVKSDKNSGTEYKIILPLV